MPTWRAKKSFADCKTSGGLKVVVVSCSTRSRCGICHVSIVKSERVCNLKASAGATSSQRRCGRYLASQIGENLQAQEDHDDEQSRATRAGIRRRAPCFHPDPRTERKSTGSCRTAAGAHLSARVRDDVDL